MSNKSGHDLSTLTVESACQIAEALLRSTYSSGFSDLQFFVLSKSWEGLTYQEMADEAGYEHDYIKQIGSQLWRSLSTATGESVSKSNIHSVLRRLQASAPDSGSASTTTLTQSTSLSTIEGNEVRWVGREGLVQRLEQKLLADIRVLALVGITGIGKSSLAIRLTLEPSIADCFSRTIVIRCDRQSNTFEQMARQILGEHLLKSEEVQKSPKQLVYALIQYLSQHQILVILDMVEEILVSTERGGHTYTEQQFEDFFEELLKAKRMRSRFIITSQQQPPMIGQGRFNHFYHLERLAGLTESEALQLFCLWDVEPRRELELDYLDRFSRAYEGHPLALQVIAGEIRGYPYQGNIQAYWGDFGGEIEMLERDLKNSQEQMGKVEHNLSGYSINLIDLVEQRVNHSFDRLRRSQPLSHQLLCMGSVFRCSVEREGWLFLIGDSPKSEQVVAFQILQRRFLVEEDLSGDRVLYRLHSLIRSVANQQLDLLDAED